MIGKSGAKWYRGRTSTAPCLFDPVTDENGDIDGKNPRQGIGDGQQVDEFFLFQPAPADDIAFDQWDHRLTSANGEHADFGEDEKQSEISHSDGKKRPESVHDMIPEQANNRVVTVLHVTKLKDMLSHSR